jgi:hypothetical protein
MRTDLLVEEPDCNEETDKAENTAERKLKFCARIALALLSEMSTGGGWPTEEALKTKLGWKINLQTAVEQDD